MHNYLAIYHGEKLLFRLRDSFTLLTSSLDNLAQNLSPNLGLKKRLYTT